MAAVVTSLPKENTTHLYGSPATTREAMIKSRFAETIAKAKIAKLTTRALDPLVYQREKLRIESELRAAASQLRQQREASRLALAEIESTVSIDDNVKTFQELKHLCGRQVFIGESSLEKLGLFLKKDYQYFEEKEAKELELMKQRQAHRNVLQMMESSANIDKIFDTETQLNQLCGWNDGLKWIFQGYPLLGVDLVLKEEFRPGDDDDDEDEDLEEGEIKG